MSLLLCHKLPTVLWQLSASFLDARQVAHLSSLSKFFNHQVVWHPKTSSVLLWREMDRGLNVSTFKGHLTVLEFAVGSRHPPLFQLDIIIGAYTSTTINYADVIGRTSLYLACMYGKSSFEVVKRLLANGANPNSVSMEGWTPLLAACSRSHLHVIRLLIDAGADIGHRNNRGETPLHIAFTGHLHARVDDWESHDLYKVATYLIQQGASVDMPNNVGRSVRDLYPRFITDVQTS